MRKGKFPMSNLKVKTFSINFWYTNLVNFLLTKGLSLNLTLFLFEGLAKDP